MKILQSHHQRDCNARRNYVYSPVKLTLTKQQQDLLAQCFLSRHHLSYRISKSPEKSEKILVFYCFKRQNVVHESLVFHGFLIEIISAICYNYKIQKSKNDLSFHCVFFSGETFCPGKLILLLGKLFLKNGVGNIFAGDSLKRLFNCIYPMLVCLFVRLYSIIVKTAEPLRPKLFMITEWMLKVTKNCLQRFYFFV